MKRALCLLLICLFCTGCSALPPEERAFCVVLLVDGGAQECTVRVRIPTYQQNGGYQTLSASGTTLTDALRTLESAAPMRLHWGQLRLIVLSPSSISNRKLFFSLIFRMSSLPDIPVRLLIFR